VIVYSPSISSLGMAISKQAKYHYYFEGALDNYNLALNYHNLERRIIKKYRSFIFTEHYKEGMFLRWDQEAPQNAQIHSFLNS